MADENTEIERDEEEEEVVGLTDAERDALNEDDTDDSEGEAETSDDSAHADTDTEGEGESDQAAAPVPDTFVPEYKAQPADDLAEKQKLLESSYTELSDDLDTKYENGELSFSEYRKELKGLDSRYHAEKAKLDSIQLKAEIAAEQSKQAAEQRWQWEQDTFFRDNPDFKTDPVLFGALNATLQTVFADKTNQGKTGLQMIRLAADQVNARMNAKTIPNNRQQLPDKAPAKGKAPAVDLPKTLANVPAAASNSDAGEFDYLDKLSGLAYEAALKRLTPEQQDRYFRE